MFYQNAPNSESVNPLYRKAADQGHAHASYNLALGHLQGLRADLLEKGFVLSLFLAFLLFSHTSFLIHFIPTDEIMEIFIEILCKVKEI